MKNSFFYKGLCTYLTILFAAFCLFFLIGVCQAGTLNIGYIYDSDGLETYQVRVEEEKEGKKTGVLYSFNLYKQQQEEELRSLDVDAMVQLDYYFDPLLGFAAIEYERSVNAGVEDKTDTGAGLGYKNDNFRGQSGVYFSSENTLDGFNRSITSKTAYSADLPVGKDLIFASDGEIEMDLKNTPDYVFQVSAGPKVKISEVMTIGLRYEHQYINQPVAGPTDHRKFMFEAGVDF